MNMTFSVRPVMQGMVDETFHLPLPLHSSREPSSSLQNLRRGAGQPGSPRGGIQRVPPEPLAVPVPPPLGGS